MTAVLFMLALPVLVPGFVLTLSVRAVARAVRS